MTTILPRWDEQRLMRELSEHSAAHKNDWNAALELCQKIIDDYEAVLARCVCGAAEREDWSKTVDYLLAHAPAPEPPDPEPPDDWDEEDDDDKPHYDTPGGW